MKLNANTNALVVTSNSSKYRNWSGNTGYDDELGSLYDYDDSVANWHKIQLGSLLFISRDQFLIGLGLVHEISVERKEKKLFSCPTCERQTLSEKSGKLFYCTMCKVTIEQEARRVDIKPVTRIQARYQRAWHLAARKVITQELQPLLATRDTQSAIREVAPGNVEEFCRRLGLALSSVSFPIGE